MGNQNSEHKQTQKFNPVIKSVMTIRKTVNEIGNIESDILELDKEILDLIEEAGKSIINEKGLTDIWLQEKGILVENVTLLRERLNVLSQKLRNKEAYGLTELWNSYKTNVETIQQKLSDMDHLGKVVFVDNKLQNWNETWKKIRENLEKILDIAETVNIKLSLIEQLKPEEIDEITQEVLKYMPKNYTIEEAYTYEKDYIQAYNELKQEASKKKNLWDKFLDILAGGIQETPAHRVQMRRWMEGDSEDTPL